MFDVSWKEILEFARKPGGIAWWQANRQKFTIAFRKFIDFELEANAWNDAEQQVPSAVTAEPAVSVMHSTWKSRE